MEVTKKEVFDRIELFTRDQREYTCSGIAIGSYGTRKSMGYCLKEELNSDFWKKFVDGMPDRQDINPEYELNRYFEEGVHFGTAIKTISNGTNLELVVIKLNEKKEYQDSVFPIDVTQLEIPECRVDIGNSLRIFMYPSRIFNYDEDKLSIHPQAIMLANDSYGFAYIRK